MEAKIFELIQKTRALLKNNQKPVKDHYGELLLDGYLLRGINLYEGIASLCKNQMHREAAHLVQPMIEMRLRCMLICSDYGELAISLLRWHDELMNRLRYLNLEHLESESAHMTAILTQTQKEEDNQLLQDWYQNKPKSTDPESQWLNNWPLWSLKRLFFELDKHLIDSPRMQKEVNNLMEYLRAETTGSSFNGMKPYFLIDEDLDSVHFLEEAHNRWPEGPLALSSSCLIDMIADMDARFSFGLENEIEGLRAEINVMDFN